jgi:hypothetical protein
MCPAITSPLPLGRTCSTSIPFTTSTLTCRAHALERMAGKLPVDPGSPPKSAPSSALLRCHPPPTAFPASTLPLTACPPPPPLPSSAPPCPLLPPSKAAWASRRARTACCFLVRVLCSISLNLVPACDRSHVRARPNRRRSPGTAGHSKHGLRCIFLVHPPVSYHHRHLNASAAQIRAPATKRKFRPYDLVVAQSHEISSE